MTDRWTDRLSDYIDGELPPADQHALEAHLAACVECRTTVSALQGVVARAGSLTARPPTEDLWPGIETQIRRGASTSASRRAAWRVSFTLPQLVAASLALMVVSGGAVWIGQHQSLPPAGATNSSGTGEHAVAVALPDPHYDEAVADLEQMLQSGRATLDPETVRVIEQNLQAIDRAIDQSRRALEQDPANIYLNNHLAEAKQQKLTLLRQATAIASTKGS
jgi:anti-sigma factor RsiW